MRRYDPGTIEPTWVAAWEAEGLYRADDEDSSRPRFYALDMFHQYKTEVIPKLRRLGLQDRAHVCPIAKLAYIIVS